MAGTVQLVVDTNLFHECKRLDAADFPWGDLGDFDTLELIVPEPVQAELDRQKKDQRQRVRRRAIDAVSWFREMLQQDTDHRILREAGPRVILKMDATLPSRDHDEVLDKDVADDRLVGVAAALAKASPGVDVRLLTDDTRPAFKSKAVGLKFFLVPQTWLRESEEDESQKTIASLEAEIRRLKSSDPDLKIMVDGLDDKVLHLDRSGLDQLSAEEENALAASLAERFPVENLELKLAVKHNPLFLNAMGRRTQFVPPTDADFARYRSETYARWIDESLSELRKVPSLFNAAANCTLKVKLANVGARPADHVRIRFTARGNFLVEPKPIGREPPAYVDIPAAPELPQGSWMQDGQPVGRVVRAHSARSSDFVSALRGHGRQPPPPEPETWYFDPDKPEEPVGSFALVCERFRHGTDPEDFDVDVFPLTHTDELKGAIDVHVSASNVRDAVTLTIPIAVKTTFATGYDLTRQVLDAQDPIAARLQLRS